MKLTFTVLDDGVGRVQFAFLLGGHHLIFIFFIVLGPQTLENPEQEQPVQRRDHGFPERLSNNKQKVFVENEDVLSEDKLQHVWTSIPDAAAGSERRNEVGLLHSSIKLTGGTSAESLQVRAAQARLQNLDWDSLRVIQP